MGIMDIVLGIIVIVIVVSVVKAIKKKTAEKKERQRTLAAEQKRRQDREELEARADSGDYEARKQLVAEGTKIREKFYYRDFDFYAFDKGAFNRLANLIDKEMLLMGFPDFTMGNIEDGTINDDPITGSQINHSEGKTVRGDTLYIESRYNRNSGMTIEYHLNLKAFPSDAKYLADAIAGGMKSALAALPKSPRPGYDEEEDDEEDYREDDDGDGYDSKSRDTASGSVASGNEGSAVYDDNHVFAGRTDSDGQVYDSGNNFAGRIDDDGQVYDSRSHFVGKIDTDGQVYDNYNRFAGKIDTDGNVYNDTNRFVGKVSGNIRKGGGAWFLLAGRLTY